MNTQTSTDPLLFSFFPDHHCAPYGPQKVLSYLVDLTLRLRRTFEERAWEKANTVSYARYSPVRVEFILRRMQWRRMKAFVECHRAALPLHCQRNECHPRMLQLITAEQSVVKPDCPQLLSAMHLTSRQRCFWLFLQSNLLHLYTIFARSSSYRLPLILGFFFFLIDVNFRVHFHCCVPLSMCQCELCQ